VSKETIKRHLNPIKKIYAKMIITAEIKKIKRTFTHAAKINKSSESVEIRLVERKKTERLENFHFEQTSTFFSPPVMEKIVE
jgi:hypothetical protein